MRILVMVALFASLSVGASAGNLKLEVFVSEPDEINVTSPMIMGETEMMVMSGQATKSSANRLADQIEKTGLKLKYIFLSHAHLDHSQGASVLKRRFPKARFIAPPEIAKRQRHRIPNDDKLASARHKENAAVPSVPAEDYTESKILIDGETVEIWGNIIGDVGIGLDSEPHVALYIPSLNALLPSDTCYYNAHVMLGGTSQEFRLKWVKQIEGWMEKDFDIVVPGHMPNGSDPSAIEVLKHSREYILAYDKAVSESKTADEVIKKMIARYPDMPHRSALYLGTYINYKQMHMLTFNKTIETMASFLPSFLLNWINSILYKRTIDKYNKLDQ